jgi:hypothetical protein
MMAGLLIPDTPVSSINATDRHDMQNGRTSLNLLIGWNISHIINV